MPLSRAAASPTDVKTAWYGDDLGAFAPRLGLVPTVRFLLRRYRVLHCLAKHPRGPLLEIGCGSAGLLIDLSRRGFTCIGLETSEEAKRLALCVRDAFGEAFRLTAEPGSDWDDRFDVVCAFEVLEHIKDDYEALLEWSRWLAPGGQLLITVPAHMSRFGPGDVWAGHYRRYERDELLSLLDSTGFEVEHVECYGFPLGNLTEWLGRRYYRRQFETRLSQTPSAATDLSGIDRSFYCRNYPLLTTHLGIIFLRFADRLQVLFGNRDWGSGYLVKACKR